LCIADPLPGGGTHLSPFAFWRLRGSWFGTATGEHGPESGNLIVYPALLSFEAFDGGGKDFSSVLMGGHLNQSGSIDGVRHDYCTSPNLPHKGGISGEFLGIRLDPDLAGLAT
jgi:hypothetical protein